MADEPVICMNPYHTDGDGNETYSDAGDPVEGWSIYRRIPDPRGNHHPFDAQDDDNFPTREAALARAEELAALHGGLEIREY